MTGAVKKPIASAERDLVLHVAVEDERWGDTAEFEKLIASLAAVLAQTDALDAPERASASILLADDASVRTLNAQFRKIDKPTNVLSFPAAPGTDDDGATYLGDVALAFETVQREAAEKSIDPRHHLVHLVAHGVLHLCGYDHMTDEDADVMEGLETAILARLGIADPYSD